MKMRFLNSKQKKVKPIALEEEGKEGKYGYACAGPEGTEIWTFQRRR